MVWRLESSWVYLALFINDYSTCCCYLLSIWLVLCYYVTYAVFYFELADDTYSVLVFVLTPTCMFCFVNYGVQQTYRRLQLNRNSSQFSSH